MKQGPHCPGRSIIVSLSNCIAHSAVGIDCRKAVERRAHGRALRRSGRLGTRRVITRKHPNNDARRILCALRVTHRQTRSRRRRRRAPTGRHCLARRCRAACRASRLTKRPLSRSTLMRQCTDPPGRKVGLRAGTGPETLHVASVRVGHTTTAPHAANCKSTNTPAARNKMARASRCPTEPTGARICLPWPEGGKRRSAQPAAPHGPCTPPERPPLDSDCAGTDRRLSEASTERIDSPPRQRKPVCRLFHPPDCAGGPAAVEPGPPQLRGGRRP